jgi:hypothetical protein
LRRYSGGRLWDIYLKSLYFTWPVFHRIDFGVSL